MTDKETWRGRFDLTNMLFTYIALMNSCRSSRTSISDLVNLVQISVTLLVLLHMKLKLTSLVGATLLC